MKSEMALAVEKVAHLEEKIWEGGSIGGREKAQF
jgi:hypothetical protein